VENSFKIALKVNANKRPLQLILRGFLLHKKTPLKKVGRKPKNQTYIAN